MHRVLSFQLVLNIITTTAVAIALWSCASSRGSGSSNRVEFEQLRILRDSERVIIQRLTVDAVFDHVKAKNMPLIVTDQRVMLGIYVYDYPSITLVRTLDQHNIEIVRNEAPRTITIHTSANNTERIKEILSERIAYTRNLEKQTTATSPVNTSSETLSRRMLEMMQSQGAVQREIRRSELLSSLGTIGIIIQSNGEQVDIAHRYECKSTEGGEVGGATGTPIDAVLLVMFIVTVAKDEIKCRADGSVTSEPIVAQVVQALREARLQQTFRRQISKAMATQLDNPLVFMVGPPAQGSASSKIDTLMELAPEVRVIRHHSQHSDEYTFSLALGVRLLKMQTNQVIREDKARIDGTLREPEDFRRLLEEGYSDFALWLARNVVSVIER